MGQGFPLAGRKRGGHKQCYVSVKFTKCRNRSSRPVSGSLKMKSLRQHENGRYLMYGNIYCTNLYLPFLLGTFISCYSVTLSPCYSVTLFCCNVVTLLPCYSVTLLPCYLVKLLLCYSVTLLTC